MNTIKLSILACLMLAITLPAHAQTDQSTPEATLKAVFNAAQTQNLKPLGKLCDPEFQNDGDTECLCSISPAYTRERGCHENFPVKDFYLAFKDAKLGGPTKIFQQGDQQMADVPFLFGKNASRNETMRLVKRGDKWYLFSF